MLVHAPRLAAVRACTAVRIAPLVAIAIVAIQAAHLPYLEAWPTAHNDEARELNAFWVAAGVDPNARLLDPEFGQDPLYKGGLQGLTVGLALRIGGLGLLQGRLVSLLWGTALLWLVFLLGRRLYGASGGVLAAFLLALSAPFWLASHMVRPDIVLATMLVASAYLALRGLQERRRWLALAAGLTLGLALDVHLNAIAFVPLVTLFYLAFRGGQVLRESETWHFAGGVAAGWLYFLLVRVLPDLGRFSTATGYWVGVDKRPPILSGDPRYMLSAELGRYADYFTADRRLELAVLLAAVATVGALAVRRRYPDPLVLGLAAALAVFTTLLGAKSTFYIVLLYPWLALLVAAAVLWLGELAPRLALPVVGLAMLLAPTVFGFQDNYEDLATSAANFPERGFPALMAEIREVVPSGALVLGPPLFWLGLSDHPYVDYYVWERLRAIDRANRFSAYMERLRPEILVLDAKSRHQVAINSPGFLESRGTLLKSVRHVGFDRVEVWKLS